MMYSISLCTDKEGLYNITGAVANALAQSGVTDGICTVFCPHTTAGLTINENADADIPGDFLLGMDKAFPDRPEFLHGEGNSAAHLKASCVGSSVTMIVENSRLCLGTWQGVFFCEFDGPRTRRYQIKVIAG